MKLFCEQMKKLPLSFKEFLPIADFGGKGLSACSNCSVTPPISWWVGGKSGNLIDFQAPPPPPGLLYPVSLHAPSPSNIAVPCLSKPFLQHFCTLSFSPCPLRLLLLIKKCRLWRVKVVESPPLSISVTCLQIQITMR